MLLLLMALTFVSREVVVDGTAHRYQVALPDGYESRTHWPVILFLHGVDERGDDGLLPTQIGLGRRMRDSVVDVPAIVIFPQCPTTTSWTGDGRRIALAALEATLCEEGERADGRHVALTGLSMGGAGALLLASEHAPRFTRVAAVCGWVRPTEELLTRHPDAQLTYEGVARATSSLPLWLFHGSADATVPVRESRLLHAARLREATAESCYSELAGVGHGAWITAYADQKVIDWLLGK